MTIAQDAVVDYTWKTTNVSQLVQKDISRTFQQLVIMPVLNVHSHARFAPHQLVVWSVKLLIF